VDVTAATATEARDQALADGERQAFQRLMERLTQRSDAARLPHPNDAEMAKLVRSLEIGEERTSTVRYLANLTVHFNREEVRRLLGQSGIGVVTARSRPALVLPVYRLAGSTVLWEEPNPWLASWTARKNAGGLVTIVVPTGDLDDVTGINAAQALAGDAARLDQIQQRYGADSVVVAVASAGLDQASGMPKLDLSTARYSGGRDTTTVGSLVGVDRDRLEPLLERGVDQVIGDLEDAWKADNALQSTGEEQRLLATAGYDAAADWLELRRRLSQLGSVRRVDIVQFGSREARLAIWYAGEVEQLRGQIARAGIELVDRDDDVQLRLAAGQPAAKSSTP
jgi:hypothetical protein